MGSTTHFKIATSVLNIANELMCAITFGTTVKGNLPHFSYILRMPLPLGSVFKTLVCYICWVLLFLGINRGKVGMKYMKYHQEVG